MKMPSLHAILNPSRRVSLLAFALTLGALVVAAVWFVDARSDLADSYARVSSQHQRLAEVRVREREARLRVDYADSARQLMSEASARGLEPAGWGERLISVKQGQLSREETATLLASASRTHDRLFGAEAFDLAVTRPEEGLFDVPETGAGHAAAPLAVNMKGTLLFRTGLADADAPAPGIEMGAAR